MATKRKTHSYRISAPHKQTRIGTHLLVEYFLKCCLIWIYPPPRIPVTTRCIILLVENPNLNLYLPLASWVGDRSNVFIHPFIFPGQLQVLANLLLLPGVSFDEGIAQHFRYILTFWRFSERHFSVKLGFLVWENGFDYFVRFLQGKNGTLFIYFCRVYHQYLH